MKRKSLRWGAAFVCGVSGLLCGSADAQENASQVRISGAYVSDILANATGGKARGARIMGKADLIAEIGDDNFGAHVDLQYLHGDSLSGDLVGDAQVVSNIDAPSALRPFQAYVHAGFGGGRGKIKAGLVDLNSDFDVQEIGALFLNSSFGVGPDFSQTGLGGPSIFPSTSTALVALWTQDEFSARLGVFDGIAGDPARPRRTVVRTLGDTGLLIVGEADFAVGEATSVQFGAWTYTDRFDALEKVDAFGAPARLKDNRGAYGQVEVALSDALDAWVRAGVANDEINPIATYIGGGLGYGEEDLRFGVAVAHARLGDPARRVGGLERAETAVELTLRAALNDRVTVQPDVQYVFNPGWDPALKNALVAGLRLHLSLF